MHVDAFEAPSEALARIRKGDRFDVAVIDMQMPEMDGLALAREIRRSHPELPLVLLTSLGHVPQAGSRAEFAAQLTKPVKASQLHDAIVTALARQTAEQQPAPAAPERAEAKTSSLRILLAEDNAVNQQLAVLLLRKLGFAADVAANGLEALAGARAAANTTSCSWTCRCPSWTGSRRRGASARAGRPRRARASSP